MIIALFRSQSGLDFVERNLILPAVVKFSRPRRFMAEGRVLAHEAGARYQVKKFMSGREVSIVGDERKVHVDQMKMTAVFMNLLGNA